MLPPTLSDRLRHELLAARRGGDRAVAATLRSTLAALANAEAVAVEDDAATVTSEYVAGLGAGATDVPRRVVTEAEQRALVEAEIAELRQAETAYAPAHPERAAEAAAGIAVLERVLGQPTR